MKLSAYLTKDNFIILSDNGRTDTNLAQVLETITGRKLQANDFEVPDHKLSQSSIFVDMLVLDKSKLAATFPEAYEAAMRGGKSMS
jgi:hypothetical protein